MALRILHYLYPPLTRWARLWRACGARTLCFVDCCASPPKKPARSILACTVTIVLVLALAGCKGTQPAGPQTGSSNQQPASIVTIDASTAGSVTGVISFKGATPKLPALDMSQDPACPADRQPSEAIVVKSNKLANVYVYVKDGLPAGRFPVPVEPAVLDQKGCRYLPHVMGMMVGQPIKVLNSDVAQHNVHPMPTGNAAWNESQMPMGQPITKTFANPEMMIPIQCNQHPWMRAYVSVMSHPYFAVSAADGSFVIKNLPPGEYTIAAVHEKFGEQTMKIKIGPKGTAKPDFTFAGQ